MTVISLLFEILSYHLFRSWGRVGTNIGGNKLEVDILVWIEKALRHSLYFPIPHNFLSLSPKFCINYCNSSYEILGSKQSLIWGNVKKKMDWNSASFTVDFVAWKIFNPTLHIHILRVYNELTKWPAPRWLDSSVGRALHRYRRGHGFESRSGLNFIQALISQLLKLCV